MLKEDSMHNGNHYDEENGNAMEWSSFIAGALIGAGVALLLAPERGTELRGKLRDYAKRAKDELMEQGQEIWDTAVERGKEYYDKGEEVVREAGQSAKEFAEQGAQQGQKAVKDTGRAAKEFAKHTPDMARDPERSAL
jgi:gas vesicle protein